MVGKTGLHALKALAALAALGDGEYMGAAAVARQIGAPQNYLGKLLQTLAREGLVVGQKGLNGGFRLAKEARKIPLLDVIEPIEHVSRWNGCFLGRKKCSGTNACAVHSRWEGVRNAYLHFLKETTVADIADAE
ncbi:MAG: Rrf2 family transcriptional regulator [Myxococcales bacterium]|nr:MAG: Rrf2 family transcriptional regulator [Myxococcales bacterium]